MAQRMARISLSLYDGEGGTGNFLVHLNVDDTLTIANAYAAINTVKGVYLGVGNAGISDGSFSLVNTAIAAVPGDDAGISDGAVFDFSNASNPTTYGQWVPSFQDALVLPGGHIDIVSAGAPKDFADALVGALLGGRYTNGAYVANDAGVDAFLSSRKRRRRVR